MSRFVVVVFVLIAVSFACAQHQSVTILHTNDMHASFLPHEAGWVRTEPKPLVGGFQELWFAVDSIRKVKTNVLLLDGGDVMTGTPIADFPYQSSVGGALFEMMNKIGYDAWTIGNHDLDVSQSNLAALTSIAHFATVSANLVDSGGAFPFHNVEYTLFEKDGIRMAVIGLMSRELFHLTNTKNLQGLKVLPLVETAQRVIDRVKPQADLIIALTHEGVDDDSVLAAGTHGLDIIIGGHSHTRLKNPKTVNHVVICQAGSNCENLGEVEVTLENHHMTSANGRLLTLWASHQEVKGPVSTMIAEYKAQVDADFGKELGQLAGDWKRSRSGESSVGNFYADAIKEGCQADVAVANSSSLRKDVPAGPITKLSLVELSPFKNYLCTFPVPGKVLKALVTRYLQATIEGRTAIDLSGIDCQWKKTAAGPEIVTMKVNGQPYGDEITYTMGSTDYTVNQADKYLGFVPAGVVVSGKTISDAMSEKVKRDKTEHGILVPRFQEMQTEH
jgi:2',3'-cyclic-nucleotide 2'-phosphodiesterase (5'-nucleotidase family)